MAPFGGLRLVLRRLLLVGSISALAVASSLGTIPTATGQADTRRDAETPTSLVNLASPLDGIKDPAAGLTPLKRDCAPGQVDVNTATAAQIGSATGIASAPALDRIVKARPWQRAVDLVSIPGVGPNKVAKLAAQLCAEPTTLPPAAAHAPKAGFRGVDLQTASATQIAAAGLLPLPVAERLKAWGPLPDDLHQVAAPAVPGLSDGTIERLLSSGRAAITPYPFTLGEGTWRWASHDHGAVISAATDSRYALIVPPRRVLGGGAWATVTPHRPEYGVLPKADFHIHGAWTPEVAVQLPIAPGISADESIVVHDAGDGARVSAGDGVHGGPIQGSVVAPATSLSTMFVAAQPVCDGVKQGGIVWCNGQQWQNLRDVPLSDTFRQQARLESYYQASFSSCPDASSRLAFVRGRASALTCTSNVVSGTTATATWTNQTAGPAGLWFGSMYTYSSKPPGAATVVLSQDKGTFTTAAFDWLYAGSSALAPKDAVVVTYSQGAAPVQLRAAPADPVVGTAYWGVSQIVALLDALPAREYVGGFSKSLTACSLTSVNNPSELWTCVIAATKIVAEAVKNEAPSATKASRAATVAAIAHRSNPALIALNALGSILTMQPPGDALHTFLSPAPPPIGTGSGTSPMGDGKYIARLGSGTVYLVLPSSGDDPPEAHRILTSAAFNCLATGYFVRDNVSVIEQSIGRALNLPGYPMIANKFAPPCDGEMAQTWSYTPVASGGNVPGGVILKVPDWTGRESYWVDGAGTLHPIADGGTYLCLNNRAPAIFNVPAAKIEAWQPRDATPATCN